MATFSTAHTLLLVVLALFAPCSLSMKSFQGGEAGPPEAPQHIASPKVLKLERQSVMLPDTAPRGGKRKNFYSAKISVGQPSQDFQVSFDLGGGTMVLPSKSCTDLACRERRRYDRWISDSAEDIQANGQLVEQNVKKTLLSRRDRGTIGLHSIDVGSGTVKGTFVRDKICVKGDDDDVSGKSEPRCFPLSMLVANSMADMPFGLEPYDGTVGLGLAGMSVSPEFNFLAGFHHGFGDAHGGFFPNSFGLHLGGDEDGGEITLGGYDSKRLTHPLKWAPVADPQEGRWQVAISAIRIGNNTLDACKKRSCRAAMDYSASLLGVPTSLATSLESVLAFEASPSGFGDGCQHLSVPDIQLELESGVTLTLPAEDFVSDFGHKKGVSLKPSCEPLLTHHHAEEPLGQDVFILGESILRRYYTFFNADTMSVGFSLALGVPSKAGKNLLNWSGGKKGKKALDDDNPVILLVQVRLVRSKTVSSLGL